MKENNLYGLSDRVKAGCRKRQLLLHHLPLISSCILTRFHCYCDFAISRLIEIKSFSFSLTFDIEHTFLLHAVFNSSVYNRKTKLCLRSRTHKHSKSLVIRLQQKKNIFFFVLFRAIPSRSECNFLHFVLGFTAREESKIHEEKL